MPFTPADQAAGYWWELSVRQAEASRTLVFDDPRRARGFFESLVADNIGVGRPHEVAAVFARRMQRNTPGIFRTRLFGAGTEVRLEFAYKHSRVKQYLKEGRALRIETVINKPSDVGCKARLEHLPEMVAKGRQAGALCCFIHAIAGLTNQSLRGLVAGLLGRDYSTNQMTYDLRRLRLHGLIERVPRTNTYVLTPEGARVALFYTKAHLACARNVTVTSWTATSQARPRG